ncbi:MAG: type IX secretion system membrane protein PorP/SprF [Flavobacteriaceae bacterium]|nr:type IX secretion system membrane protein PorP/SprF [Flavobacteriaceae bacterium]
MSVFFLEAQETLPVYSDYLSDNIYLVHPAAAGIGNCAKLRITHRQQWPNNINFPSLQTLSFHSKVGEKTGLGFIFYNDRNGFHSQTGFQGTYAYHVLLGNNYRIFNQLSFALSVSFVENSIDERTFNTTDPVISGIIRNSNYFNFDFGMAYHFKGMSSYFSIKNVLLSDRTLLNSNFESLNLRRYITSIGYYFGKDNKWQLEPSILGQYIERTKESFVDFNLKTYKKLENNNLLWLVISYRKSFDKNSIQKFQQFTPIVGMNFGPYMVSYTYTQQIGNLVLDAGGYHQFTLGVNLFCRTPRAAACPNINSLY